MTAGGASFVTQPGRQVGGEARVPGDKSISHRAAMLAGIASGTSVISGFLEGEDCLATLAAMRQMGVGVERIGPERLQVTGVGLRGLRPAGQPLDMGNAGTAMRLMTGLLAGQAFDSTLVGDASLTRRPMERVAAPLRRMGAVITTHGGCPPVLVRGGHKLHGCRHELPVASAQVKSAILLAGLLAEGRTTLVEPAGTRDHTERMLRLFGADIEVGDKEIALSARPGLAACHVEVPGDFSSAAFLMVAALVAGAKPLCLRNVGINPTRTGLLEILRMMGADIRLHDSRLAAGEPVADIEVFPSQLQGIAVPSALVPLAIDEFPVLFAAAALAAGETTISGAEELRFKESDRIATMANGLQALGIEAEPRADGMKIRGGTPTAGEIDSAGDHRVAMSFAVLGARAAGPIMIKDVANVATSFPGFLATARQIGLNLEQGGPLS